LTALGRARLERRLLSLYELLPFERHPLWLAVRSGTLSIDQILRAETQHFIRTRAGQQLRRGAVETAKSLPSQEIFELLLETYLEECTDQKGNKNHLDLIRRLLQMGGMRNLDIETAASTPANSAAIALYRDISSRGATCHMLGAGVVEHFYSILAPKIYQAYTSKYGMSSSQAETYAIHGPMDAEHAARALRILPQAVEIHGVSVIEESVRDAFVATSLHYDGMLHAATDELRYWDGRL
jgi:pyrroloquinoline quinone (PQQ) biosynthesis protein C